MDEELTTGHEGETESDLLDLQMDIKQTSENEESKNILQIHTASSKSNEVLISGHTDETKPDSLHHQMGDKQQLDNVPQTLTTGSDSHEGLTSGHRGEAESNTRQADVCLEENMDVTVSDKSGIISPVIMANSVCATVSSQSSLEVLRMQYREDSSEDCSSDSDSDSDSSSSSSSSSSSEVVGTAMDDLDENECLNSSSGKKPAPLKTQDEVLIEELPAVEDLTLSLPEDTVIEPVGVISSVVEQLVIIESFKNTAPLKDDSVLFNKDRLAVGKVFEVFGPVCQPYYILRFNSHEDIKSKGLKAQDTVYFAPKVKDFTDYIFTEQLKQIKGSDASWKNDQEPPPEALDFSDDEQERLAKQRLKEQRKQQNNDSDSESDAGKQRQGPPHKQSSQRPPKRKQHRGRSYNTSTAPDSFYGNFHSDHHVNPYVHHGPPDCRLPPPYPYPPPPLEPPVYPNYQYPRPPPPHMQMPWMPYPNQGPMFYPPPPLPHPNYRGPRETPLYRDSPPPPQYRGPRDTF
ncbi:H/ACA ribonucleoprotein complex non-core subunit NAF1 [Chanos chanos]|uniref:H/ACA ribonucleoprotein complex non-core subunit NAF1 n=1 Tax=Chanos chanos TaxID=29144 RepID=A0A6J2VLP6_CHACN|nr:H/ACA ribonucleoprotein complex non-core subunit NAF1-like [Chanos chanos]